MNGFPRLTAVCASLAIALGALTPAAGSAAPAQADPIDADQVAQTYYKVLLRHTQFAETRWDAANQCYSPTDYMGESLVLGNAVLLTKGTYDPVEAGVGYATLMDHTLKSITYFAATNRFNGGALWGKNLFWDATYESYFLAAAHLLWDQLDATTRANVLNISKGQADYTLSLGTADDPGSGGWSPNGAAGGYVGDSKIEEMGVYALGIAPALAYNPTDPSAADWAQSMGFWTRNMVGLPAADKNNPALLGGVPVLENTAHNVYDGFLVENHDSFAPHYQEEIWRTMARGAVHFLLAGTPLPEVLQTQANGQELLATILADMSDSGEPFMVTVQDREYLYGRDTIPLAYLAQMQANPYVARAEKDLADNLADFQEYGGSQRIAYKTIGAQTAGEIKYEGEARSEVAISYLLHDWRASQPSGPVRIATEEELFDYAATATDYSYGTRRPGLMLHQTQNAWAAAVDRAGFTKFAWQPEHDSWLFKISGATPFLLPTTSPTVSAAQGEVYSDVADGFDGTASMLTTATGKAGMATLPTGTIVYSTSGTATGEGVVNVRNIDMGGVKGLDGDRDYTTAEGTTTFTGATTTTPVNPACAKPGAASRRDCLEFEPVTARYIRVQGINRTNNGNYTLRELQAQLGATGPGVIAPGRAASEKWPGGTANLPAAAIDGDIATFWRSNGPGGSASDADWWQVDLGAPAPFDRITADWGTEAAAAYAVQVSNDGATWQAVGFHNIPASVTVFPRQQIRYVRYQGVAPHASYGYSIREIEVHDGDAGPDLTREPGAAATASSEGSALNPQRLVSHALDGNYGTWWSVAQAERPRLDSWYQVDLGSLKYADRVSFFQEIQPVAYEVQISADAAAWNTVDFQAPGVYRVDNLGFAAPVTARYVRMQGLIGHSQYGYSVYEFQATTGGAKVAAPGVATASSQSAAAGAGSAAAAADGAYSTRWAVSTADRGRGDSWLQLDFGAPTALDGVRLLWE
ncbi:MAG: discoidin domain-containing protein, partial [Bifidobacteriaceae bacterium]|nr:discoidin domain-containing protein [Bifidobacteriaceae bacterium]